MEGPGQAAIRAAGAMLATLVGALVLAACSSDDGDTTTVTDGAPVTTAERLEAAGFRLDEMAADPPLEVSLVGAELASLPAPVDVSVTYPDSDADQALAIEQLRLDGEPGEAVLIAAPGTDREDASQLLNSYVTLAAVDEQSGEAVCFARGATRAGACAPPSDETQILGVIDAYGRATAEHDAALFCNSVAAGRISESPEDLADCEAAIGKAMEDPEIDLATGDPLEVVGDVKIQGDYATVDVRDDGDLTTVTLVREPAGWRLQVFD